MKSLHTCKQIFFFLLGLILGQATGQHRTDVKTQFQTAWRTQSFAQYPGMGMNSILQYGHPGMLTTTLGLPVCLLQHPAEMMGLEVPAAPQRCLPDNLVPSLAWKQATCFVA